MALRSLHWHSVCQRFNFKTLPLVYKSLHSLGPKYMSDFLLQYLPSRPLRSAGTDMLIVKLLWLLTLLLAIVLHRSGTNFQNIRLSFLCCCFLRFCKEVWFTQYMTWITNEAAWPWVILINYSACVGHIAQHPLELLYVHTGCFCTSQFTSSVNVHLNWVF